MRGSNHLQDFFTWIGQANLRLFWIWWRSFVSLLWIAPSLAQSIWGSVFEWRTVYWIASLAKWSVRGSWNAWCRLNAIEEKSTSFVQSSRCRLDGWRLFCGGGLPLIRSGSR